MNVKQKHRERAKVVVGNDWGFVRLVKKYLKRWVKQLQFCK